MDTLDQHRQVIKQILSGIAQFWNDHFSDQSKLEMIFDDQHNHYMLLDLGWTNSKRVQSIYTYIRLHNNKFWVEEDWTEDGVATNLLDAGISRSDIVLAFHAPEMRTYSEFAVA